MYAGLPGGFERNLVMLDIEERRQIPEFPRYEVSNLGRVYNIRTGREMQFTPTREGLLTVGMMLDNYDGYPNHQCRRSVIRLVAEAFVPGETKLFNTPVQLDGDRYNLRADNLVWRPRWFAWRYIHQFVAPPGWYFSGPVFDVTNDIEYATFLEAAVATGSLVEDIRKSCFNEVMGVFPGGEQFIY